MRKTLGTFEILIGTHQDLAMPRACLSLKKLLKPQNLKFTKNSEKNMVVRRAQQAQPSNPFSFCFLVKIFLIKVNIYIYNWNKKGFKKAIYMTSFFIGKHLN